MFSFLKMRHALTVILSTAMMLSFASAHAESKKLCGQNLKYTPVAPNTSVPQEMSLFSGIWTGQTMVHTEFISCTAFVIQRIDASGRAEVMQAWGSDNSTAGSWAARPQDSGVTKAPWVGHVVDGTLVLVSDKVSYKLKLDPTNPNKMEGSVYDANFGTFPVQLNRIQNIK